jgi:hypothetical protein
MSGAILPLPQYAFMAWCLVKHRDNFTFYILHKRKRPPGRLKYRCEDNFTVDIKTQVVQVFAELNWLKIRSRGGVL